jgi:hypothetical protein
MSERTDTSCSFSIRHLLSREEIHYCSEVTKNSSMQMTSDTAAVRLLNKSHFGVREQNCEKRPSASCSSVCPSAWYNFATTGQIFMKFYTRVLFGKLSRKFKFNWTLTITDTWHADLCTFMKISRWILLRMRNVSGKICRENQNKAFLTKS